MRRPPKNKCLAWQCDGELEFVGEDPDNYNLQLIDERYSMLRPEEHTAMVPQADRERYVPHENHGYYRCKPTRRSASQYNLTFNH